MISRAAGLSHDAILEGPRDCSVGCTFGLTYRTK